MTYVGWIYSQLRLKSFCVLSLDVDCAIQLLSVNTEVNGLLGLHFTSYGTHAMDFE